MIQTTQEYQIGDTRKLLGEMLDERIDTIITSPPYWGLRDYGVDGHIGLEPTLKEYHTKLLAVTKELKRVLKPTGVMFWVHGDSYGGNGNASGHTENTMNCGKKTSEYGATKGHTVGYMPKCMLLQNERLIMKTIDEQGWILRNRIIWHKNNGMPSSVNDRFSNKYESVYMFVKQKKYWFDLDAVRHPHKVESIKRQQRAVSGKWQEDAKDAFPSKNPHNINRPRPNVNGLRTALEALDEGTGLHPLGKNPGDVWTIPTQPYPESHFATFPTALIEPIIKAACPAEICPVCGMARERITEPTGNMITMGGYGSKTADHIKASPTSSLRTKQVVEKHTTGWTSCDCDADWIAGTVLDPFCGSGTVLEVCRLLNRNAIGFELNPDYEPMIQERSIAHIPPLTDYFLNMPNSKS